jgi:lipopolysaccharide/colanic/teichoic acid biosynthesis glycosyltransferase
MLFVSLLIFIVSPGPVIFKQPRVGFLYKPFTILKFRTMRPGCDEALHRKYVSGLIDAGQPLRKLDSYKDPRLIPFGAMLRRCFLDELPQLINVLRGQMSLVGPRPCLPYEAEKLLSWQKRRFYALPGMTGPWQVNGKESATYLQMLRYDVQYAHTASTFVNLKILLKTIPAVMGRFHKNGFRNSMRLKPSLTNFSRHT